MGDDGGREPRPRGGARTIALVGPFASGKTTLLEAILERTSAIPRQGTVTDRNTVGDASPEARAHAMSVEATIAQTRFMGDDYTFIECPGSTEFLGEADGILAAVDCAVVVCEADARKVPALQLILKRLDDLGLPRIMFLNKVDRSDLPIRETLAMLQPSSAVPLVLREIPLTRDGAVTGYIDLALERAFVYREHAASEMVPIPDDVRAAEVSARYEMLERLADYDDQLMEQLLEEVEPPRDRVFDDLATEMRDGLICPVFFGSAEHGNGILRLLKALRHETPGLSALHKRLGFTPGSDSVLQVMKTIHAGHGGKLSVARVLAGDVADGMMVTLPDGRQERVSGLYRMLGTQTGKRETAHPGDTVALGKLDGARTGDTLTSNRTPARQLAEMAAPDPVMTLQVHARDRKDEVKLSAALAKACEEDPSLRVVVTAETSETLLIGQGEMHLRVTVERLTSKYGVSVTTAKPSVAYRETIKGSTVQRGRHKKQSGGHGQFGDVVLEIRAQPRGGGITFTEKITGGVVPRQYIPGVETGVRDSLKRGPLGFPVVDVAVTLTDGSYHSVDSSDQAFQMAARLAMREGLAACTPVLLEPIERVEITCPSDVTARVNAIVSGRRGQLLGFDARPGWTGWDVVETLIPASEIGDLIVELRSASQGVASFRRRFDHLQELSGRLAEDVVSRQAASAAAA
ncbi:elongation factor G [Chthonobacter albigriseus]|uniref:elongation factor G n=1 Tax=Chthonobacter albigriseus TaxID=1683161 RepID=UPI0015EF2006|nr:elongation factor G [Chthonobacter albigriseus]